MGVVHVVPSIANEASGPSYSVVRLCESLIAGGKDVLLAALDWAPMPKRQAFLRTFPLGWGPRRLGPSSAMKGWLARTAANGSVDVIHNHSLWMMPNVYSGQVARAFDIPLVVSPRGTLSQVSFVQGSVIKRVFWPLIQKPALRSTTCFHATALSEFEDIRRMGFRQPVAIIPNGVDIRDLRVKRPIQLRTLLFLGRIHPIKGLDMLLPAWRAVQDRFPDWQLRIAGPDDGGYLDQVQQLAGELGLRRVEFVGAVYGDTKWQMYRDADLFVLPTYSENFGMSVAEALAAGIPAIVSKGAPWAGLAEHDAGCWIDVGVDALVAAMEQMLSYSAERLELMGRSGRDWMLAEYNWVKIGRQMAETYRWLLGGQQVEEKPEWVLLD